MQPQMVFTAEKITATCVAFAARQVHAAVRAPDHIFGRRRARYLIATARFGEVLEHQPHDDDGQRQEDQFTQVIPRKRVPPQKR